MLHPYAFRAWWHNEASASPIRRDGTPLMINVFTHITGTFRWILINRERSNGGKREPWTGKSRTEGSARKINVFETVWFSTVTAVVRLTDIALIGCCFCCLGVCQCRCCGVSTTRFASRITLIYRSRPYMVPLECTIWLLCRHSGVVYSAVWWCGQI